MPLPENPIHTPVSAGRGENRKTLQGSGAVQPILPHQGRDCTRWVSLLGVIKEAHTGWRRIQAVGTDGQTM